MDLDTEIRYQMKEEMNVVNSFISNIEIIKNKIIINYENEC